jgi:pyrimidine-specific ribonucleoside hydrolase
MTRLLIDTDVALGVWHEGRPRDIDDGFAIVEAINATEIDLVGVTCVYGNGPIDEVYRVAREIVELKHADVPVKQGAGKALDANSRTNPAVEFIADALAEDKLTIAAIGPLTNIGLLIKHHPEVLDNIEQLIMVAGRSKGAEFYIGDAGPVRDFNFENDVAAAELIMASGVECVLMGFELTSQVCVTQADLEVIQSRDSSTAQYFYDNSTAWCSYWTDQFPVDAGFHPWDSAAIAWVLNPDLFVHEQRGCKISRKPKRFECDAAFPNGKHIYCTGFTEGGSEAFVKKVIAEVY